MKTAIAQKEKIYKVIELDTGSYFIRRVAPINADLEVYRVVSNPCGERYILRLSDGFLVFLSNSLNWNSEVIIVKPQTEPVVFKKV